MTRRPAQAVGLWPSGGTPGALRMTTAAADDSRFTPTPPRVDQLKVKIFADGADRAGMLEMARKPWIAGLTTNPTLMRKAGVGDYRAFAKDILKSVKTKPISFEVFCDDFAEMERQAGEIAS